MSPAPLSQLVDRARISEVLYRYASGVDGRDWTLFRSCFEDEILIDLSSWNGAPAATMPADAWVMGVRAGLSGFDATQHLSANHVFDRADLDRPEPRTDARCTAYMQASHVLEGARVTLGGYYETRLTHRDDAWRIAESRLTVTWRSGSERLFAEAAARHREAEAST
jgi:hypothetical protein